MPIRFWGYNCGCAGPERPEDSCPRCGVSGVPLGWRMSEDEKLAAFSWSAGLPTGGAGPTSHEARELEAELITCPLCEGEGLIQPRDRDTTWAWCPVCDGRRRARVGHFYAEGDFFLNSNVRGIATGYWHRRQHRPDSAALLEDELEDVKRWLAIVALAHVPLVPAIHEARTGLIVVGPSHEMIINWARSLDLLSDASQDAVRTGFIELTAGDFLDPTSAMRRARRLNLTELPFGDLEPEWLEYHREIPMQVVRGGRQKRR